MKSKKLIEELTLEDIIKISKPNTIEKVLITYKGKSRRILGSQGILLAEMIANVYNNGTILNWENKDEKKWFGWYNYSKPGSGFFDSFYFGWPGDSSVSSRLHFKEEKLFWLAVKNFPKVYENLMVK